MKKSFNFFETYKNTIDVILNNLSDLLGAIKTGEIRFFHILQIFWFILVAIVAVLIFVPLFVLPFPILAAMMVLSFPFSVFSTLFCVFLWQIISNAYWFSDEFIYFLLIIFSWVLMVIAGYLQWFVWGVKHKKMIVFILLADVFFVAYLFYRLMTFTFVYR